MAAQLVGGAFLSAFLQVAFDRLSTTDVMDFIFKWKIDLDEVENLKRTSTTIQALTDDAEVKQFTNLAVKLWVDHLKQLLYDAEDILDEYVTDILRVKLDSDRQVCYSYRGMETAISPWFNSGFASALKGVIDETLVSNPCEEVRRVKESRDSRDKVKKINEMLLEVAKKGFDLGLGLSTTDGSSRPRVLSQRPRTSSLVNKNSVFGREEDKKKIIEFLLRLEPTPSENNYSVLPIVGMGGIGKTTLAQLVYDADELMNHDRLMNHFDLKAWVCVGDEFDSVRITKEILESVTRRKPESDLLDRLQNQLQAAFSKKKFLLVLDDVWNLSYNKWDNLQIPFATAAQGSKIIVTTRDSRVSSIMRNVTAHRLECLSDDACILLLRRHAFVGENSLDAGRRLQMFGGKVVEICKGLPLAIKIIAGLLRDKKEDKNHLEF